MTTRRSVLLVIDASVMQAAGETAHPVSSACRNALIAVLELCHRVATTERIRSEWKKHMSRFSRKWMRSMGAHRKHPQDIDPEKAVVDTAGLSEEECAAVEKDLDLVEAALSAGCIIVTRDDALRAALAKSRDGVRLLEMVRWINPVSDAALLKAL